MDSAIVILEVRNELEQVDEEEHNSTILEAAELQLNDWNFWIEEGSRGSIRSLKIRVETALLAGRSTYFCSLLNGDFRESHQGHISILWDIGTFFSLLCFMYSQQLPIFPFNIVKLLEGSVFFGIEAAIFACAEWVQVALPQQRVDLTPENLQLILGIWNAATSLGLKTFADSCVRTLAINFGDCMLSAFLTELPFPLLRGCIDHRELTVYSEKQLLRLLLNWVTSCCESARKASDAVNGEGQLHGSDETEWSKDRLYENMHLKILEEIRGCLLPVDVILGDLCGKFASELFVFQGSKITEYNQLFRLIENVGIMEPAEILAEDSGNFTMRITQHSKILDLSGCYQINVAFLFQAAMHCIWSAAAELNPEHPSAPQRGREAMLFGEGLVRNSELQRPGPSDLTHHPFTSPKDHYAKVSWPAIPSFRDLYEINLAQCWRINQKDLIMWLGQACPNLRTLNISHCPQLQVNILTQLCNACRSIEAVDLSLDISTFSIEAQFIVPTLVEETYHSFYTFYYYLSHHSSLNCLTNLSLQGRSSLKDQELITVAKCCPNIASIHLGSCSALTDHGMSDFLSMCHGLRSFQAPFTAAGHYSVNALLENSLNSASIFASESLVTLHCTDKPDLPIEQQCSLLALDLENCSSVDEVSLTRLLSRAPHLTSLHLGRTCLSDDALLVFFGTSLEHLDVRDTQISGMALAQVISRNSSLKYLNFRGCKSVGLDDYDLLLDTGTFLNSSECNTPIVFKELGKGNVLLEDIVLGWGLSDLSFKILKPALRCLKRLTIGAGGSTSKLSLLNLSEFCPDLEQLSLCFQVVSDDGLIHSLTNLTRLHVLELCHCIGELSPSFTGTVASSHGSNLTSLKLERVVPWITDSDVDLLTKSCQNLRKLSFIGCKFLTSYSLYLISSRWCGVTELQLEECGSVTSKGAFLIFQCRALNRLVLRHNGAGLPRNFVDTTINNLPLLRTLSLDLCDSAEKGFDIPQFKERRSLSTLKLARCRIVHSNMTIPHEGIDLPRACHKDTFILEINDLRQKTAVVSNRI